MTDEADTKDDRWWAALGCAAAGAAVFQFFGNATRGYIDTASLFRWWTSQWFNEQSETQHGLIIAALAVWLLNRNLRLAREAGDPSSRAGGALAPLMAMVLGLALHAVGFTAQQARVSIIGLLVFAWGVLRLGGGRRWGNAAMFPMAFMVFAIPFNALDTLGFWLRLWVIKASTGLAHLSGISVVQNGTQLLSADGRYQYDVAAACSGIRSLMALLALSVVMGYVCYRSWWARAGLFLLCFPLIYAGNVVRISSIIFMAEWRGQQWGERAHDVMGWGVFVIVLGGLMLVTRLLPPRPVLDEDEGGADDAPTTELAGERTSLGARRGRGWGVAGAVGMAALGTGLLLSHLSTLPARGKIGVLLSSDGLNPAELPKFLGTEWIGRSSEVSAVEREILPPDTGYARKEYVAVADSKQRVFVSVVLSGRDRTSIHRPELCLVGQGWTIDSSRAGQLNYPGSPPRPFPVTLLRVQREMRTPQGNFQVPQLVGYWFIGGDRVVGSHWRRLLVDAWNRVMHARADRWAYVLVQTDAREGEEAAIARIQAVMDQALPAFVPPPRWG